MKKIKPVVNKKLESTCLRIAHLTSFLIWNQKDNFSLVLLLVKIKAVHGVGNPEREVHGFTHPRLSQQQGVDHLLPFSILVIKAGFLIKSSLKVINPSC